VRGNGKHGLLLIAHGSREEIANREVEEMAERMSESFGEGPVIPCFLEIARPRIPDGFLKAVDQGCKRITAIPLFLASGYHVTKHIPEILEECRAGYPDVQVAITAAIGPDLDLDRIALKRVREPNLDTVPKDR